MNFKALGFLSILFLMNSLSYAYYTTGESAELVQPGQYQVGLEPQLRLSDGTGVNFNGFLDAPFGKDGSIRAILGFGNTDFYTSLGYKWVPVPDYDRQPAIGGKLEVIYSRVGNLSATALKLHPIVSKKYEIEYGTLIPYGSIPLALFTTAANSDTSLQLVGGAELLPAEYRKWKYSAELGVNMNKAFSYISGTVVYLLDDAEIRPNRK